MNISAINVPANTAVLTFIFDREYTHLARNAYDLVNMLDCNDALYCSDTDSIDTTMTILHVAINLSKLIPFPNNEEEYKSSAALAVARLLASDNISDNLRSVHVKIGVAYGKFNPEYFMPIEGLYADGEPYHNEENKNGEDKKT